MARRWFQRSRSNTRYLEALRCTHLPLAAGGGILVLVVAAPPLIRRGLRPALRRILPVFLPAERRQVQEGPGATERLDASPGSEVGAIDVVAIAEEDAETEGLACVARDTEVDVEVAAGGGEPRHGPAHALLVTLNVRQWSARHQRK